MYERFKWSEVALVRNAILWQYEPLQPFIFYELCRRFEPDIFFDVGSNVGSYSIVLSSLPSLERLYAFEPAPDTFQELLTNVQLNSLGGRVKPVNAAVSDREGQVEFAVIGAVSGANGIVSTHIHGAELRQKTIGVDCQALDAHHRDKGQRIVMKVDVEGHERSALDGARQLIANNDCLIQVEFYRDVEEGKRFVEGLGCRYLFHIGPDHYFGKGAVDLVDSEALEIFQRAASEMLKALQVRNQVDAGKIHPIRRTVFPGLILEVTGELASRLRKVRSGMTLR